MWNVVEFGRPGPYRVVRPQPDLGHLSPRRHSCRVKNTRGEPHRHAKRL